jgi:TrmH family RNA methyltransferase
MIIEGQKELSLALKNNHNPSELFICRELIDDAQDQEIIDQCKATGTTLFECTKPVFEKIAYRDNPHGLLAVTPSIKHSLESFTPPADALIVIAESIEKPGNLGTILRSADAAGAHAVIVCDRCTDINNPNVIRASIGTIFTLPVIEASSEETFTWLKENKIQSLATTPDAKLIYTDLDMTPATAIIVGAEKPGLSEKWLQNTDQQVAIPMLGQSDSLNVASATTILLYETLRQRSS